MRLLFLALLIGIWFCLFWFLFPLMLLVLLPILAFSVVVFLIWFLLKILQDDD